MNIKKIVSRVGYALSCPISRLCALLTSGMTPTEAHRILSQVYDIDRDDLSFIGGGQKSPRLLTNSLDISFVIPVYNSEPFLERCLRSILCQQTTAHYEVICVNDGSTDGSAQILERLQREFPDRLRIESQSNQGISATRNRGIEMARGEYVGFIDNDDFVADNYVETLWQRRLATEADMIQIGHLTVDMTGRELSRVTHPDTFIDGNQEEMQRYVTGYVWSGIHRKRVFSDLRFATGFWYEDMITKMILSRLCRRYAFVSDCLYTKTVHQGNASLRLWSGKNPKCLDQLYLVTRFADYATDVLGLDVHLLGSNVLNELRLLWGRTKGMNRRVREAAFVMGGELLRKYPVDPDKVSSPEMRRYAHDFMGRHYWKWEVDGWIAIFEKHR